MMKWRGFEWKTLPAFHWVIFELIIFILLQEIGFYYFHRLLHLPSLYKRIHKQHHEWTAPISITAIYCHPIEHITNLLSVAIGIKPNNKLYISFINFKI